MPSRQSKENKNKNKKESFSRTKGIDVSTQQNQ
jgi:hypothetical protein